jgi:hypothetical protein
MPRCAREIELGAVVHGLGPFGGAAQGDDNDLEMDYQKVKDGPAESLANLLSGAKGKR